MALLSKAAEQQFGAGIWPDYGNDTAPMIIESNNIQYQAGRAGPIPATLPFFSIDGQVDAIHTQNVNNVDVIFLVENQNVRLIINNVLSSLSFLANRRRPMFASFGNFTLMADGLVLAARRGVDETFERIAGAPESDFVISWSPFVVTFKNRTATWCSIDNIDEWEASAETQARSLPIRDMDSDIVGVIKTLGGVLIFSQKRAWFMSFIGSPNWFGIQPLENVQVGPYGQQALAVAGNFVVGVGTTGIWRTDGNSHQYFDRPQLRNYFYKQLGDVEELLVLYDHYNERIMIVFDDKERQRKAICWDERYENWYPTGNDYTAVDRGSATEDLIFGDGRGRLLSQNQRTIAPGTGGGAGDGLRFKSTVIVTYSFGVQPFSGPFGRQKHVVGDERKSRGLLILSLGNVVIPAQSGDEDVFFETRDLDFGTTKEKYIDQIVFRVTPGAGFFYLKYAIKDRLQDPVVWSDEFLQDPDKPFFDIRETARYLRVHIRNSATTSNWQLTSIDIYGEVVEGRD